MYMEPRMDENHPEDKEFYKFYGWKENAITLSPQNEKPVRSCKKDNML